jgi:hypothetical protein
VGTCSYFVSPLASWPLAIQIDGQEAAAIMNEAFYAPRMWLSERLCKARGEVFCFSAA